MNKVSQPESAGDGIQIQICLTPKIMPLEYEFCESRDIVLLVNPAPVSRMVPNTQQVLQKYLFSKGVDESSHYSKIDLNVCIQVL